MNSTFVLVLHWTMNIILLVAGIGLIILAIMGKNFGVTNAGDRIITVVSGLAFLFIGGNLTWLALENR